MIQFQLVIGGDKPSLRFLEGHKAAVVGRCWDVPIPLGATFIRARTLDIQDLGRPNPIRVWSNERKVALRVDRISAYGHDLLELSEGMTAELELSGEGVNLLRADDVLDG